MNSRALSSRVWNGLTGVSRPGENVTRVRRRHQQQATLTQNSHAFGDELRLVPQMFDDLKVDDDIHRTVRQRQRGEVATTDIDARITGAHVGDP